MKIDYLGTFWQKAPFSWAIIRAVECELLEKQKFKKPVLEVGCGDGWVSSVLFRNQKQIIDLGIDIDTEEVRRARRTGIYKKVELMDITKSGLKANSFNTVFSNGVLEHIPDLEKTLSEIARILKPGGKLITTSPTAQYTHLLFYTRLFSTLGLKKMGVRYGAFVNKISAHVHLLTLAQWRSHFKKAGLKLTEYQFYNDKTLTALHDVALPFAMTTRLIKKQTDKLVLFPNLREFFTDPLSVILSSALNGRGNSEEDNASVLLVAEKI